MKTYCLFIYIYSSEHWSIFGHISIIHNLSKIEILPTPYVYTKRHTYTRRTHKNNLNHFIYTRGIVATAPHQYSSSRSLISLERICKTLRVCNVELSGKIFPNATFTNKKFFFSSVQRRRCSTLDTCTRLCATWWWCGGGGCEYVCGYARWWRRRRCGWCSIKTILLRFA